MTEQSKRNILRLVESSRDAVVCAIDDEGFPNAKAMFRRKNEGLRTFWFSTNTSAIHTAHYQKRSEACIYFMDAQGFHGLMLTGRMEVRTDDAAKRDLWADGDEQYYALGPTDPDYAVLVFTADKGNYYHGLEKALFNVKDF